MREGDGTGAGAEREATGSGPNWADLFDALAADGPDHPVVVCGEVRLTWDEFERAAARTATFFAGHGVGPGDHVAVFAYNRAEYLVANYAAMKLRAAVVNVNFRYTPQEVRYHLDDSGAGVLLYSRRLAGVVAELDRPSLVTVPIETLLDSADDLAPHPPVTRSGDDEFLLYTGGTTGMPKGVVWNHADLFRSLWTSAASAGPDAPVTAAEVCRAARAVRRSGDAPVLLSCGPLVHGMGIFQTMSVMVRGGTAVLLTGHTFDPVEVWDTVAREGVTDLAMVGDAFARPLVRELRHREAEGRPVDLGGLRVVLSGGMTWSADLKREFRARGDMVLLEWLGASEGGPLGIDRNEPGMPIDDGGRFTLGPDAVLLDEYWRVLEPGSGRSGVLGYRGAASARYHRDEEKTAEVFREIDGVRYVVTGDFAQVDAQRRLTFLGRGSGCINSGGEKVYPAEVEAALAEHPQVRAAVVVGVPHESYGEAVAAVVETEGEVTDDDLTAHVHARLARYKAPRRYARVDAVRHHESGKVDYPWVRRRLGVDGS